MFSQHPQMAHEWAEHTPDIKALPEHVGDKKKKKEKKSADLIAELGQSSRQTVICNIATTLTKQAGIMDAIKRYGSSVLRSSGQGFGVPAAGTIGKRFGKPLVKGALGSPNMLAGGAGVLGAGGLGLAAHGMNAGSSADPATSPKPTEPDVSIPAGGGAAGAPGNPQPGEMHGPPTEQQVAATSALGHHMMGVGPGQTAVTAAANAGSVRPKPKAFGEPPQQGMSSLLKALLWGGGIGLGGYGLYKGYKALTGKSKKEKEEEERNKYGSAPIELRAVRRAILTKIASLRRKIAADILTQHLTKVAAKLPAKKRAPVMKIQEHINAGKPLSAAIKTAYPHLTPESRGLLAAELVKSAVSDYNRKVSVTQTKVYTGPPSKAWTSEGMGTK
jgi:hypothetical protein